MRTCIRTGGVVILWACLTAARAEVYEIGARDETEPLTHSPSADDSCIWVHPSDPSLSTIIGTDKHEGSYGGLRVYNLQGTEIQFLPDGKMNNVDIRYHFPLGTNRVDLVTSCERNSNSLAIYKVDPDTRMLTNIAARAIHPTLDVYGSCMYRSKNSGRYYTFITAKSGMMEQWELFDNGSNRVDAMKVRTFEVGTGWVEGCVADDESGDLYVGEEDVGIWKYGAEPDDGTDRVLVDTTGSGGHVVKDVEGLTLYYAQNGQGYLLASSQGEGSSGSLVSSFAVYERQSTNTFVLNFRIVDSNGVDQVTMCDGIDVCGFGLGPDYPNGLLVAHDDSNAPEGGENYKLVPWEQVARCSPDILLMDTSWNPRDVGRAYTLHTGVEGGQGGISPTNGLYAWRTNLVMSALPAPYYTFSNWAGDLSGTVNPSSLLMDSDHAVEAVFEPILVAMDTPQWWLAMHGLGTTDEDALEDTDLDSMPNWAEYQAGTVPTNALSFFRFASTSEAPDSAGHQLQWESVSNRIYTVSWSTNMGDAFVAQVPALAATPPLNTFTDTVHQILPTIFYRLSVRKQDP